eukprot:TRINITY_DN13845_c2_g2_i1.p1 TRINITY_DN13845_c2_g2~~TRINITY_DN13845_c2_g2_i1.p1  ORF type:complete len:1383 (+),score=515.22 TRINITY_DN13845_c2_g2_i1:173-4321(+)
MTGMRDAVSEVRYQALRTKLNDLRYYQPLDIDSSLLVDRLLKDLVESVERTQALKKKGQGTADDAHGKQQELVALKLDNPRLQAENNALHLQLIEAREVIDREEADARLQLRSLEDKIERFSLSLQQAQHAGDGWERELDGLREHALDLFRRIAPPPPPVAEHHQRHVIEDLPLPEELPEEPPADSEEPPSEPLAFTPQPPTAAAAAPLDATLGEDNTITVDDLCADDSASMQGLPRGLNGTTPSHAPEASGDTRAAVTVPPLHSDESSSLQRGKEAATTEMIMQEALRACEEQILRLEADVAKAEQRSVSLEEAGAAQRVRVAKEGPDLAALKRRAEEHAKKEVLHELQAAIESNANRCTALEKECAILVEEQRQQSEESEGLLRGKERLHSEEAKAAAHVEQVAKTRRERGELEAEQLRRGGERSAELTVSCESLVSLETGLAEELQAAMAAAGREERCELQQMAALEEQLAREAEKSEKERVVLAATHTEAQAKVRTLEAAKNATTGELQELQGQVQAARSASQELAEQLKRHTSEIEEFIVGGAKSHQMSQRSNARTQFLVSSLRGLEGERSVLQKHLAETQAKLHERSLEAMTHRLDASRLEAVVKSFENTREDWTLDFERATSSLRRAHGMLSSAKQRTEVTENSWSQMKQRLKTTEESEEVAAKQEMALSAELETWRKELSEERLRFEATSEHVAALRKQCHALEEKTTSARSSQDSSLRTAASRLESLQTEVAAGTIEEARLREKIKEAAAQRHFQLTVSESGLQRTREETQELRRARDARYEEATRLAASMTQEEVRLRQLSADVNAEEQELQELLHERREAAAELAAATRSESATEAELAELQERMEKSLVEVADLARARLSFQGSLARTAAAQQVLDEQAAVRNEELRVATARVEAIEERCDAIRAEVEELLPLGSNAETAREHLTDELAEQRRRLEQERRERQMLESGASGWGEEQSAAAAEVQALRHAMAEIDAQRDERQRVVDIRAEEVEQLRLEIGLQEEAALEAREAVDTLRAAAAANAERLAEHSASRGSEEELIVALRDALATLRTESKAKQEETAGIMEDLVHMTRENQALHQQTRVLEISVANGVEAARGHVAEHERSLLQLRTVELERDDVVRLYQQVGAHARQQGMVIERLQLDTQNVQEQISQLQAEMRQVSRSEEESLSRLQQTETDLSVMEGQVQGLTQRLTRSDERREEARAEDAKLEGDVATAAELCKSTGAREVARQQEATVLGLRRTQLLAALQQARNDIAVNSRLTQEGRLQLSQLEELMEEDRKRCSRRAAENEGLRRLLEAAEASASRQEDADSGKAGTSAEIAAALQEEVERRYAKVGDLDAEQQSLVQEAQRLEKLLQERRQAAAASP